MPRGSYTASKAIRPITLFMLRALLGTSKFSLLHADGAALATMSIFASVTKARCNWYLPNGTFDPDRYLTIGAFRFEFAADGAPVRVIITFKHGTEVAVGLGFPGEGLCCVSALCNYFLRWRSGASSSAPVFTTANESAATCDFLGHWLRAALMEAGIDPSLYAPHSFRLGGELLAAEDVPEGHIY